MCDNMDGPRRYYAKWNKSDKEKQIRYGFNYIWNKKKKNKKVIKSRVLNTENKEEVTDQRGMREERNRWERLWSTKFQMQNKWFKYEVYVWKYNQ